MSLHGRKSALRKKANRGFRGYPLATMAFYGPDDQVASKVAVGVLPSEHAGVSELERWFSDEGDVRVDPRVEAEVIDFIKGHGVKTVVIADAIMGCPHEKESTIRMGPRAPSVPTGPGATGSQR